ncbi:MAG: glutathione S-transferase family protein [Alphaproteobacteria bacterium]|nr:glutathione S-transferase family protein [Alphaproteobacteria bacterium]
MSKLIIHGAFNTRTSRVTWMALELGLDFEHNPIHYSDGRTRTPEFLAINPNGTLPAIQDGDLCLWESLAINLYLANKHGGDLAPRDAAEMGLAMQWSFWATTEVEEAALDALKHRLLLPEADRDQAVLAAAEAKLAKPLSVLDGVLADRDYLFGGRFTVADLNVAAVVGWAKFAKLDLSAWPNLTAWLDRCLGRPAFKQARGG